MQKRSGPHKKCTWYVRELSQITGVSVQTLHHYDRLSLLKPSTRLPNGYRLYTEADLLRLQHIIALKFFGFSLSEIKNILENEVCVLDQLERQAKFLDKKAKKLLNASKSVTHILHTLKRDVPQLRHIPWQTITHIIEVYHMTEQFEQELKKTWATGVLNEKEMDDLAAFEAHLKSRIYEKDEFDKNWEKFVGDLSHRLNDDPESEVGIDLGKRCMDLVNTLYETKYAALRVAIWEKGFKGGHMTDENGLSPAMIEWLDKATSAYYRGRIMTILSRVGESDQQALTKDWHHLLDEMFGDNQDRKKEIYEVALNVAEVSFAAKIWLKTMMKSLS